MKTRPLFEELTDAEDFDNWYWMKEELVAFCKASGIPYSGSKNELRQRIMDQMNGVEITVKTVKKPQSHFDWARETITLETILTDSVTFGTNFRGFLKKHITGFVCSAEFMDWVKKNAGKTVEDAITKYPEIMADKKKGIMIDKSDHNVLNAYVDAFMKANPQHSGKDAMKCWLKKKFYPAKKGLVKYEKSDLRFL